MKLFNIYSRCVMGLAAVAMLTGCKDNFLDPDPQSFFSPESTYATEAGWSQQRLVATVAIRICLWMVMVMCFLSHQFTL